MHYLTTLLCALVLLYRYAHFSLPFLCASPFFPFPSPVARKAAAQRQDFLLQSILPVLRKENLNFVNFLEFLETGKDRRCVSPRGSCSLGFGLSVCVCVCVCV